MPDVPGLPHESRWLVWKMVIRNGDPTKVPYDPKNGNSASITDPATWSDLETARGALLSGKYDGLGFVLGDGIAGVDLDKCRNPETGTVEPWAQRIVNGMNTYTEVSPSGRGLHLLLKGSLPEGSRRFLGRVEMYDTGRYFTVTRQAVVTAAVEERTAPVKALHEGLSDAHNFLRTTKHQHPNVLRLWAGDIEPWQNDDSKADAALVCLLADYAVGDAARIDRLFRLSSLYRPKWDEPRGDSTYGAGTIQWAIERTKTDEEPVLLRVRTWNDMLDHPLPPPTMLVDRLFRANAINMIAGPSYAGKSTVALDVALSIATGVSALCKFPVPTAGPVLYVFAEQGEADWEYRLQTVAEFRGIRPGTRDLPIMFLAGYDFRLNQPTHIDALVALLLERQVCTVIFDTLSAVSGAEGENGENDSGAMVRNARRPLQRIIQEAKVTPIVLHHSTKSYQWAEPHTALDLVRGSGDLTAMTSAILGIWHSRSEKMVKALPNVRGPAAPFFWLGPRGAMPVDGRQAPPAGDNPAEAFSPLAWVSWFSDLVEDPAMKVYRLVLDAEGPVSATEVSSVLGVGDRTSFRHLNELVKRGIVRKHSTGFYEPVPSDQKPATLPTDQPEDL